MSKSNRRKHDRIPVKIDVKIVHPDIGEKIVSTRNISDGGIFLLTDPVAMPKVGEKLYGQVVGMIENPPIRLMEVVRYESEGIGLQFVDEED